MEKKINYSLYHIHATYYLHAVCIVLIVPFKLCMDHLNMALWYNFELRTVSIP